MRGGLALLCLAAACLVVSKGDKEYSNKWVAEIEGGEDAAKLVAKELGYTYDGPIEGFDDHYLLTHEYHPVVSKSEVSHLTKSLLDHDKVRWAQQQSYVKRSLRTYGFVTALKSGAKMNPLQVVEFVQTLCLNIDAFKPITPSTTTTTGSFKPGVTHSYSYTTTYDSDKPETTTTQFQSSPKPPGHYSYTSTIQSNKPPQTTIIRPPGISQSDAEAMFQALQPQLSSGGHRPSVTTVYLTGGGNKPITTQFSSSGSSPITSGQFGSNLPDMEWESFVTPGGFRPGTSNFGGNIPKPPSQKPPSPQPSNPKPPNPEPSNPKPPVTSNPKPPVTSNPKPPSPEPSNPKPPKPEPSNPKPPSPEPSNPKPPNPEPSNPKPPSPEPSNPKPPSPIDFNSDNPVMPGQLADLLSQFGGFGGSHPGGGGISFAGPGSGSNGDAIIESPPPTPSGSHVILDPFDPNFVLPPGATLTYLGPDGKPVAPNSATNNMMQNLMENQGDTSKIGSFSTKPNTTTHYDYEGVTKHINLLGKKKSAYRDKFNDPLWSRQWQLQDYRTKSMPVMDLNVVPVWDQGITGKGIVVAVVDDGVQGGHPDLKRNFLASDSYDYLYNREGSEPDPEERPGRGSSFRSHGTSCAGEIGMEANNKICGVGVAHNCSIIGVKINGNRMTPLADARGLTHKLEKVDIYSNSWGPQDDGKTMVAMNRILSLSLTKGFVKGRNGLGVIYTVAGGNGRDDHDNCGADHLVNSIFMMGIAAVSQSGKASYYSERCTAIFAATYSSGLRYQEGITTTDVEGKCTNTFTGTSAATPLASAIYALVLEANPKLTNRDVMHITAMGSEVAPLADNGDVWYKNKKGFWVSNDFGFGLLNAENMIDLARGWTNVPVMTSCTTNVELDTPQQFSVGTLAEISFDADACQGSNDAVFFLEAIVLRSNIECRYRGAISMYITSPMGTRSHILEVRPEDNNPTGLQEDVLAIKSLHNWGENPKGTWTLEVRATALAGPSLTGTVNSFSLSFYGTKEAPAYHSSLPRTYSGFRLANGKSSTDQD